MHTAREWHNQDLGSALISNRVEVSAMSQRSFLVLRKLVYMVTQRGKWLRQLIS